jgi:peroxiredoxin Q/BCP
MALKTGDRVPQFSLLDQHRNTVSIEDFKGKNVVLFFYPADHTFGCTREACSFRDNYDDIKAFGAEVIGISPDTESSHRLFASHLHLPFILLSDPKGKVGRLFGLKKKLMGLLGGRMTFIIDKQGVIRHIYEGALAYKEHSKQALTALKELEKNAAK